MPYFDCPYLRARWLTTTSAMLDALLAGDRRQEPVHLAVQLQSASRPRRGTPSASSRSRAGARRSRPRSAVGDHRRQPPRDERVLPILPPAADDVVAAARASRPSPGCRADRSAGRRPRSRSAGRARDAKPAAKAAVWPKLRRKRITRRRGSPACSRARICKALVRAAVVDDDDLVRAGPRRSASR